MTEQFPLLMVMLFAPIVVVVEKSALELEGPTTEKRIGSAIRIYLDSYKEDDVKMISPF